MTCSVARRIAVDSHEAALAGVELLVVRLDCSRAALEQALSLLVDEERARAARFLVETARRRFVVARATLRQLLGEWLGVAARSVRFTAGAHGKPALAWPLSASGLRFNVSHSESLAAYAFAQGREVGIDIEALRPLEDAEPIARRFFSEKECGELLALDPADRRLAFFRCWTRKEAFVKAIGEGLSHPLGAFDVSLKPGEPARLLRLGAVAGERCGWRLGAFDPGPGFVGALAVQAS